MLKLQLDERWGEYYKPDRNFYENMHGIMSQQSSLHRDNLGWTDIANTCSPERLECINKLAQEVRADAQVFVLVGIGGSNNAARAVIEALPKGKVEIIYAGNTICAYETQQVLNKIKGKSAYINVIAKNFETLEPGIAFRVLRDALAGFDDVQSRIIVTGSKGSALENICEQNGYRFLEFPLDIGGRYSALSAVGLFPMAVSGVDIEQLVKGAISEQRDILNAPYEENEAFKYAAGRFNLYNKGYLIELLTFFEPRLQWLQKWWAQLFAESEGKMGKGIFPSAMNCSEDLHSLGQFVQDGSRVIFETFLRTLQSPAYIQPKPGLFEDGFEYLNEQDFGGINDVALQATYDAHARNVPCVTINIPCINAEVFGRLFVFFEYACYYYCTMLGVNPFDQPGVEAYKARMFELLGKTKGHE